MVCRHDTALSGLCGHGTALSGLCGHDTALVVFVIMILPWAVSVVLIQILMLPWAVSVGTVGTPRWVTANTEIKILSVNLQP